MELIILSQQTLYIGNQKVYNNHVAISSKIDIVYMCILYILHKPLQHMNKINEHDLLLMYLIVHYIIIMRGGLVVKVSASCPKDRGFEPHQGHDHVSP